METIFHLVPASDCAAAQGVDEYATESLESEGFIHCSKDHPQVLEVANRLFRGRDDMLVLELDLDRLASPIKDEAARSGTVYPHIYGKINTNAVIEVLGLTTGGDGQFNALFSGCFRGNETRYRRLRATRLEPNQSRANPILN